MNVRNFYLVLLLVSLAHSGLAANDSEDISQLQQQVYDFTLATLRQQSQAEPEIEVNRIDPRLRLNRCDKPLTHSIQSLGNSGGHLTVQTQCQGTTANWTIYTPASVKMISQIAVLNHNLQRGHKLSADDLSLQDYDTSMVNAGYITDLSQAEGMELKRSLRQGEALRASMLVEPEAVKRGDKVVVEARSGSFSVVTAAEAMTNGRIGEQIRVRNIKSERVIRARVIAEGRVEVAL